MLHYTRMTVIRKQGLDREVANGEIDKRECYLSFQLPQKLQPINYKDDRANSRLVSVTIAATYSFTEIHWRTLL